MVGTLDLPGLKNMKVGLETLDLMGFPRDRIVTVLNRADSKVGLDRPRREGRSSARRRDSSSRPTAAVPRA